MRTLKEQLLWIRRFATVTGRETALREFRDRFTVHHRGLGHRTPVRHRPVLLGVSA